MSSLRLSTGLEVPCLRELPSALDERDAEGISDAREGPATRSDLVMPSDRWTTAVVGKTSPWIDMDSDCAKLRAASEKAFKQEVAWASHLGVPAVMVPAPSFECANAAMHINQSVIGGSLLHYWVTIPLMYSVTGAPALLTVDDVPLSSAPDLEPKLGTEEAAVAQKKLALQTTEPDIDNFNSTPLATRPRMDPWQAWNTLRTMTEYNPQVSVVLEVTSELPSDDVLAKWLGEPVKAAVLPTSIFQNNAKGYPTLPSAHRQFIQKLFLHKVQFILRGRNRSKAPVGPSGDPWRVYHQYLHNIVSRVPPMSEKDEFERPYYDYLQAPLQPLMDNLESQIYEVFEKDPIKYQQYELAVKQALEDTPAEKTSVVMVVGAGRGPIVSRVLSAAEAAERNVKVYAVEKNPNAVITLRNLKRTSWGVRVTVVSSDMRVWEAPEKADILVSELLGSFGDNELSPECLDGAQKFLKEDGISIPSSYTSFLAPIMSSKLWNEVKNYKEPKWFETPFVVKPYKFCELAEPQPVFTFVHPNRAPTIDNRRYACLRFSCTTSAVIHGFSGYFDSTLYKDVHISINPATHSPGMFSWFPIYIPLKEPLYVDVGDCVEVRMWRCVSSTKVWYEWAVTSPTVSIIHNPQGRSYWIGL